MTETIPPPPARKIAFKEWAGVCRALATGRQIVVLRKGGIAENPGGFAPEHADFWLFPTHLHEGSQGLKAADPGDRPAPGDPLSIETFVRVEAVRRIEDLESLDRIRDEHVWTDETIRNRFFYRKPGLWMLAVRVYSAPRPVLIRPTIEQEGCKSWVELDPPLPIAGLVPALSDAEFESRLSRLLHALEPGS